MQGSLLGRLVVLLSIATSLHACSSGAHSDAGTSTDAHSTQDASASDDAAGFFDAGQADAIGSDAMAGGSDAESEDVATTTCDPQIQLDTAAFNVVSARMSSNGHGGMIVGWQETIDMSNNVESHVRIYSGGAFKPEHILMPGARDAPVQALDGLGNAIAYYTENTQALDGYRARYDATTMMWSTPELWLHQRGYDDSYGYLDIAANATGAAVYGLVTRVQGQAGMYATHYNPTSHTWSMLEALELGAVESPVTAINDAGEAVAVWFRIDLMPHELHARALHNGVWGPIARIRHGTAGGASDVEVLPNGDAIVATSSLSGVAVRRYSPSAAAGSEWGTATVLQGMTGGPPRVLVDADGIVTIGWLNAGGLSATRDLGMGFGPTVDLGPALQIPTIALDSAGNVSAIVKLTNAIGLTRITKLGTTWSTTVNVAPTAIDPGRNISNDVIHDEHDHPIVVFDAVDGAMRHLYAATCH